MSGLCIFAVQQDQQSGESYLLKSMNSLLGISLLNFHLSGINNLSLSA